MRSKKALVTVLAVEPLMVQDNTEVTDHRRENKMRKFGSKGSHV